MWTCRFRCKSAQNHNIPLEINLAKIFNRIFYENKELHILSEEEQKRKLSKVIYPRREFWEIAANYNVKVLYGIDVHHKGQIPLFNELVNLENEIIGEDTIKKLNFLNI